MGPLDKLILEGEVSSCLPIYEEFCSGQMTAKKQNSGQAQASSSSTADVENQQGNLNTEERQTLADLLPRLLRGESLNLGYYSASILYYLRTMGYLGSKQAKR